VAETLTICAESVERIDRRASIRAGVPGHSRARAVYERTRRRWRLGWRSMKHQEFSELDRMLNAVGAFLSFDWVPPDESAPISARVVSGTLRTRPVSAAEIEVELEVEEVL
jgi:phage-related protein